MSDIIWEDPSPAPYVATTGGPRSNRRPEVRLTSHDHFLASGNGVVSQARVICWESQGRLPSTQCHWCDWEVWWKATGGQVQAQADHLNSNSIDNRPENLVPACYWCNVLRSSRASGKFTQRLELVGHLHPRIRTPYLKMTDAVARYERISLELLEACRE